MRILYIDLDCCRADHLGVNGYFRDTSPNIDRIASEGVSFTRAYCANSPCVPSRASLFSGRFGVNNGVVGHHDIGAQFRFRHGTMLPDVLWRQARLKTVTFSSFADRHDAWWYCSGWEEQHTFTQKRGMESADEVNAAFLPWLAQHGGDDDWFIHLHYWDIHAWYRFPDEWENRFADDPGPDWPDEAAVARNREIYGPRTAIDLWSGYRWDGKTLKSPVGNTPDRIETLRDSRKLIDSYDASIAWTDHHIGQVLDTLADLGVLDDTVVIVSADHGDSFGEHGQYMDHGIANEAVHHIPMIVRWPGVTRPGKSDAMIYGMDLGPTLCELLGIEAPGIWDGRSFAPALRGEDFEGWPYQVWDHGIYTLTRAVRKGDWLLIHVLHPGLYPYDEPCFLHNLKEDPHQERNLASARPDICGELNNHLVEWRHEQVRRRQGLPDPLEQMVAVGPFYYYGPEEMLTQLNRTGRETRAAELRRRLERYHPGRYA